jgi:hypothetical protein
VKFFFGSGMKFSLFELLKSVLYAFLALVSEIKGFYYLIKTLSLPDYTYQLNFSVIVFSA